MTNHLQSISATFGRYRLQVYAVLFPKLRHFGCDESERTVKNYELSKNIILRFPFFDNLKGEINLGEIYCTCHMWLLCLGGLVCPLNLYKQFRKIFFSLKMHFNILILLIFDTETSHPAQAEGLRRNCLRSCQR